MDAFEDLIALLLRRDGYWTTTSYKVELTKAEKRAIGTHSVPRWEIDVLAYKGATNELLAVECKSFLDSQGVLFRGGKFESRDRYKLFERETTRRFVLDALARQAVSTGACAAKPRVTLVLATGHIASRTDRDGMRAHFARNKWLLFDDAWVQKKLQRTVEADYENEVAIVVAKILAQDHQRG
jgi:hypothetical protein